MLDFCSQILGTKEQGRLVQCKTCDLSYKEAAPFFTVATPNNFQSHYNEFIKAFPKQAKVMSAARPNGCGPGETVAWFLYDNVTLGGMNAPHDIYIDGEPQYEFKAGTYRKYDHSLCDFKLSRDHDPSVKYIVNALSRQVICTVDFEGNTWDANGMQQGVYNSVEFLQQVSQIIAAKSENTVDKDRYNQIVNTWKDLIFTEYVQGKMMGLIQADNLRMQYLGPLSKNMVGLHRIHRNQPWARVYLPKVETKE